MLAQREVEEKEHFLTSGLPMLKCSSRMSDFLGQHFLFESGRESSLLATSDVMGALSQALEEVLCLLHNQKHHT